MKANILLDDLPREVKVDGMWYPVNYGYPDRDGHVQRQGR